MAVQDSPETIVRVRRDDAGTGMRAVGVTERWGSGRRRQLSSVAGRYGRGRRGAGTFPIYFIYLLSKCLRNERTLFCNCTPPSHGTCPLSNFDFQLN